jgi:DNA-binding NarL/FixJ family response regulator
VLIVDDQTVIRRGLRMWLELQDNVEVVGEAGNGHDAVRLAITLHPDAVLMDVEMPVLDGIAATAALRAAAPQVHVIVQSIHTDAATRSRALPAGAVAFFGKGTEAAELLATIQRAAARRPASS